MTSASDQIEAVALSGALLPSEGASKTKDRCEHCGAVARGIWTRASIIAAAQAWAEEHGQPPTQREWWLASPFTPGVTRCRMVFGSWSATMAAAGFTPRKPGGRLAKYTREQAEQSLFAWVFAHGRVPTQIEWTRAVPDRPSLQQVKTLYGGWNAFLVAAGYEPHRRHRSDLGYARQAGAAMRERDATGAFAGAAA